MADTFDEAEVTGKLIADLVRRRALRALAEHDEALSASYRRIAEGLRRDLRATGFTIEQIEAILERRFSETREQRLRAIERAIRDAAVEARALDKETFEAIFGREEVLSAPSPLGPSSALTRALSRRPANESDDEPPSTA